MTQDTAKYTYKVVAYDNDAVYIVGRGFRSVRDAEQFQARMYEEHPGVDFYVE